MSKVGCDCGDEYLDDSVERVKTVFCEYCRRYDWEVKLAKAEARVKELEATVTNVIRWLNGGCSVEPAIEELNLVMEQSNDE